MASDASPRRLVLATHNEGKRRELEQLLRGSPYAPIPCARFGVTEPDETAADYVGNAILKARHVALATGMPALGDDSGLDIEAAPDVLGVHTARWIRDHGGRAAAFDTLRARLGLDLDRPRAFVAHLRCALALVHPDDPEPRVGEGSVAGWLRWPPTQLPGPAAVFECDGAPLETNGVLLPRRLAFAALSDVLSARGIPVA